MLFFFLSYARGGDENDKLVEKFYQDLSNEVRNTAGEPPGTQVGFLDVQSIHLGAKWSPQLVSALAECRTFLALCSPRYFNSDACGQEWTIFEQRLRDNMRDMSEEPPLLMPIVWWHSTEMHPIAAQRQYTVASLEKACHRDGLRQLMRLRQYRDVYRRTLSTLATHIVTQARAHPIGRMLVEPRFDQVPSAFSIDHAPGKGKSQFVHFVVSAGTRTAMRSAKRRDLRYYGETALAWASYKPEKKSPLGQLASDIAEQSNFGSEIFDSSDLLGRMHTALQRNQIVVLLADVWVSKIEDERDRLRGFVDAGEVCDSVPCAVLLPGNASDAETHAHWHQLKDDLVTILPRRVVEGDARMVNLGPIRTHGAFEADLRVALQTARQEVFRRGTVHGRVEDTDASPRPILSLPQQPSEQRDEGQS